MADQWTDRLSEYLDGELADAERAGLEAHLTACGECDATLAELRRVVTRAGALEERPPAADLWPAIAARIGLGPDRVAVRRGAWRRRFAFTVPQLAAASLTLVAASAGLVWLALRGSPGSGPAAAAGPVSRPLVVQRVDWMPKVEGSADAAVAELRAALAEARRSGRLDSATVADVERNLAVIDSAIAEAKRALETDPGSAYLNHHLAETYRRKLGLLRQATRLVTPRT